MDNASVKLGADGTAACHPLWRQVQYYVINSMFFMELFGKMELNSYLCRAKKERDGLRHQRYITQTGYRTLPEFAKKEKLRIIPQQFLVRQYDTVQLTYPYITFNKVRVIILYTQNQLHSRFLSVSLFQCFS